MNSNFYNTWIAAADVVVSITSSKVGGGGGAVGGAVDGAVNHVGEGLGKGVEEWKMGVAVVWLAGYCCF